MIPELQLLGVNINWFWFFNFIGIPLSIKLLYPELRKVIEDKQIINQLVFMLTAGGFIFAKVFSTIEYYLINGKLIDLDIFSFILNSSGMRWYGALLGNLILLILLFYKNLNFISLITKIFVFISLGAAIGKLGCLFSGHGCYGIATDLPWGLRFSFGSAPSEFPVHPTPAYDAIIFLLVFGWGYCLIRTGINNTFILLSTTLMICISEFLIEYIRPNPEVFLGMNFGQICYLIFFLTVLAISIHKRYSSEVNN